jgi:flavin-binding protein dodecin
MKKYLIVAIAFVVISVGVVGGASIANAHEEGSSMRDRVVELLGVSPDDLDSAVAQARTEARAERLVSKLEAAVVEEIITQEETDAIEAWFNGKPEALSKIRHMGLRQAVHNDEFESFLAGLVADEVINQAESDEISSWISARPSATEKFREFRKAGRKCKFRHHGSNYGFGGRWHGHQVPAPSPTNITTTGV